MKSFLFNFGYYSSEIKKILKASKLSNVFSILGSGLILFLLGLVFIGYIIGANLVEILEDEAEVSVFYDQNLSSSEVSALMESIRNQEGVRDAQFVEKDEAYARMEKNLGDEAGILQLFDDNIFERYIEVNIELETMEDIISNLSETKGITHVRDNREVLTKIKQITTGLSILGLLVMLAVGITTLVIVSHLIRQGILINSEQINTLRLLGAPESFIGFPFFMAGLFLALAGGILAAALMIGLVYIGYDSVSDFLLFVPLPIKSNLMIGMAVIIPGFSLILGVIGGMFGLSSIKEIRSGTEIIIPES